MEENDAKGAKEWLKQRAREGEREGGREIEEELNLGVEGVLRGEAVVSKGGNCLMKEVHYGIFEVVLSNIEGNNS